MDTVQVYNKDHRALRPKEKAGLSRPALRGEVQNRVSITNL
jgi:hypothetical protein